jgi:hypothetical protein
LLKRTVQEETTPSILVFWAMESKSSMYHKVVIGLLATLFQLDVFLLLKAKNRISDTLVIGVYTFTISFMLYLLALEILADKIGLKKMLILE